jgi:hypothetical protein
MRDLPMYSTLSKETKADRISSIKRLWDWTSPLASEIE